MTSIWTPGTPIPDLLRGDLASYANLKGGGLVWASHNATYLAGTLGAKFKEVVSVKDHPFLAKGDGVTDDLAALQAAADYCAGNGVTLLIPRGTYMVSGSWRPPATVPVIGSGINSQITATTAFAEAGGAILDIDNPGSGTYNISNLLISANSFLKVDGVTPNTLKGIKLGGSKNAVFTNLIIARTMGASVEIYPEDPAGGDVDNFTFYNMISLNTGGVKIRANAAIARGNITNGTFQQCNIISDDRNSVTANVTPGVQIDCPSGRFVFGLNFVNNFYQSRNAPIIQIIGAAGSLIYNNNFTYGNAEQWGNTPISTSTPIQYWAILDNVSYITMTGKDLIAVGVSNGVCLRNGTNNCRFNETNFIANASFKARMFDIDASCYDNTIYGMGMARANYIEDNLSNNGNSCNNLFGAEDFGDTTQRIIIKDLSTTTRISNAPFVNSINLLNDPVKMFAVTGGALTNYGGVPNLGTVNLTGGVLVFTMDAMAAWSIQLPFDVNPVSNWVACHLRYRVRNGYTGGNIVVGMHFTYFKTLIPDNKIHDLVFICPRAATNTYQILPSAPLNVVVDIDIYRWEVIDGPNIPYVPNYSWNRK